jgi:hypothetical protein
MWRTGAVVAALVMAVGCGGGEEVLDGYLFDVTGLAVIDDCNDPTVPYQETFEYRLSFDEANVVLSIGADDFATGRIAGCAITYDTAVWNAERASGDVKWQLSGEAVYRQGGDTCNLPAGMDWEGTETFSVVASEDPSIPVGCQYVLDTTGVYLGPAGAGSE